MYETICSKIMENLNNICNYNYSINFNEIIDYR